jgi:hypothetical protein
MAGSEKEPSGAMVIFELAGGCILIILLLPFLPVYLVYKDFQLRSARTVQTKAKLVRREYVDRMGWLLGFEVYGGTVTFEAAKIGAPPPEGAVGVLSYRAWKFISFSE